MQLSLSLFCGALWEKRQYAGLHISQKADLGLDDGWTNV